MLIPMTRTEKNQATPCITLKKKKQFRKKKTILICSQSSYFPRRLFWRERTGRAGDKKGREIPERDGHGTLPKRRETTRRREA